MDTETLIPQQTPSNELPKQKTDELPSDPAAARAWQRLSQSPYRELKGISCGIKNGVLVLRGQVSSFYLKQLAQEIVRRADGVQAIANQLEVRRQHA